MTKVLEFQLSATRQQMPPKLSDLKQPPLYYSLMVLGWWGPGGVSNACIPRWWRVQSRGLSPCASGVDPGCWLGSHLRLSADHRYVASVCSLGFPTAWHLPVPSEPQGETACLSPSWSQKSQSHPHCTWFQEGATEVSREGPRGHFSVESASESLKK